MVWSWERVVVGRGRSEGMGFLGKPCKEGGGGGPCESSRWWYQRRQETKRERQWNRASHIPRNKFFEIREDKDTFFCCVLFLFFLKTHLDVFVVVVKVKVLHVVERDRKQSHHREGIKGNFDLFLDWKKKKKKKKKKKEKKKKEKKRKEKKRKKDRQKEKDGR